MELQTLLLIESRIKLIEEYLKPEPLQTIIMRGRTNTFNQLLDPPVQLDNRAQYGIALEKLYTCYSIANINSSNNLLRYFDADNKVYDILIPEGSYELESLIQEIESQQKPYGHWDFVSNKPFIEIQGNYSTGHSIMKIKPGFTVDFSPKSSLSSILGFEKTTYTNAYNESENLVEIKPIKAIFVHCNFVNGAYYNGQSRSIVYSFGLKVPPGYDIVEEPKILKFHEVIPSAINIQNFQVWLTDEELKPIDLRGEEVILHFVIRKLR